MAPVTGSQLKPTNALPASARTFFGVESVDTELEIDVDTELELDTDIELDTDMELDKLALDVALEFTTELDIELKLGLPGVSPPPPPPPPPHESSDITKLIIMRRFNCNICLPLFKKLFG